MQNKGLAPQFPWSGRYGRRDHSFCWTQLSSSSIVFPEIAPEDGSKQAAVEDEDSLLGHVLFPWQNLAQNHTQTALKKQASYALDF
jgi:hypothetical protein